MNLSLCALMPIPGAAPATGAARLRMRAPVGLEPASTGARDRAVRRMPGATLPIRSGLIHPLGHTADGGRS